MAFSPHQSFAERHGGLVISAVFHGAFFVLLHNVVVQPAPPKARPEPQPIRIELTLPPETAAIPSPPVPPLSSVAATVADAQLDDAVDAAAEAAPRSLDRPDRPEAFQVAALPAPATPADLDSIPFEPEPSLLDDPDLLIQETDPDQDTDEATSDEDQSVLLDERVKAYLEDRERRLTEYNKAVGQRGSDLVAQKLSLARAELEGKRWLETTEGGQEGAIRSFTSSGVPPKIAEEVYARYGIRAFDQFVDIDRANGADFLNSATVGNDRFVRREGRGMFRVLTIPQSAYAFLATLERDALIERGHDPARTRILEVEFGVASVGSQYDLVVTRLRVAPMEFQP